MPFSGGGNLLQLNSEQFDFNLQFEQLFFSIIPAALFISAAIWRAVYQARRPVVVKAPIFQSVKVGVIGIYAALELALLIVATVGSFHVTSLFVAASALKLVSALFMTVLSVLEHSRSPRPSMLLSTYLFLILLLDIAQTRTLFLSSHDQPEVVYSILFSTTVALEAVILHLEAIQKTRWTQWDHKAHSPEETGSIFNIGVFYWLNNLFRLGYSKILALEDLYPLDLALDAESLHRKFSSNIDYEKLKGDKFGLVKVLVRTMKYHLLIPVPARLARLGFELSQPFFIERLLSYLDQSERDRNIEYGFIGAALLIYAGIAISKAYYWYLHNRARTVARSILVTEIYNRAIQVRIGASDDNAALTLMSADMERIRLGFRSLHEIWACVIQVALSGWMLYLRLGVVFIAPIGLVIVCFVILAVFMQFAGDSQKAWMAGVQKRTTLTATAIASMKNLKMSGLSGVIGGFIQRLRIKELAAGARFRKIFITAAMIGFIPHLIGPPITFAAAYSRMDVSTVFSSLSFITLVTHPLELVFESLPQLIAGITCLGRIQSFLERDPRQDYRQFPHDGISEKGSNGTQPSNMAMTLQDGSFGWEQDKPVLKHINFKIPKSSLTLVVGAVGAGKSTLCKALLGEIPFSEGQVKFGLLPFDNEMYVQVIRATALDVDFATLQYGDLTNVGSDGITLSGGQKQRVSLARALYLHPDMLVLDDVFSGLDADTEHRIFRDVFGAKGLLRRLQITTILCTHSVRHLPAADQIIVLESGTIVQQGRFDQLMMQDGYVQQLGLESNPTPETSKPKDISTPSGLVEQLAVELPDIVSANDASRQAGDAAVYKHYAASMGWFLTISCLFSSALWGFFTNYPTIWLTYWTDDVQLSHPSHSHSYYASIYAVLNVCALVSLLLLGVALLFFAVKRAGAHLHQEALDTLIHAPLQFLTTTDTGVITNLFSQDLNLIDTELPDSLLNTLFCVFQAIGQAAVMLTSSAYLAIAYPFLGILLYLVGRFYLRTSRQLRLLDLELKSPLYTHFIDTLKGIATLRASGFATENVRKNIQQTNTSQRPAYLLLMIQEWLNLVLGLVVMILAVVLVTLAVRLDSSSGFAGASLYSLITLGENLAGIVLYFTRLETCLGAISRLQTFRKTATAEEKDDETVVPPESWPSSGVVELSGVSASYSAVKDDEEDSEKPRLALDDIHLKIHSGEKLAICGRTGSGKSSVLSLLLKFLEPTNESAGEIMIDGIPLSHIDRSAIRQRIIAVPQEAVFLPDGTTFQTNLDPTESASIEQCIQVLKDVGLWEFIEQRGGVQGNMYASALSGGQRQLISIGRALLRARLRESNYGILLLDEVSSSVDRDTERLIQGIIRTEFDNYTVIAISHRLDMIMDFDRVVVMESGRVVEVGKPVILATEQESRFGELVRAAAKDST
ncbi:unnamed protein product [Periconia digitata]|uniref:Uncharacterized protein n=1 Tax=Periconia digitata TaxID=1303443 RepID=A0A9W4UR27_9PLEO|nr:unnamed protein product [Periconia digitata]